MHALCNLCIKISPVVCILHVSCTAEFSGEISVLSCKHLHLQTRDRSSWFYKMRFYLKFAQ